MRMSRFCVIVITVSSPFRIIRTGILIANNNKDVFMDDYTKTNLNWWNEAVAIHARGEFYRLESFKVTHRF